MDMFFTRNAAYWSAVAGSASAIASFLSLSGVYLSIRYNRRITRATEAALRIQICPTLLVRNVTPPNMNQWRLILELKNVGNGPALMPMCWEAEPGRVIASADFFDIPTDNLNKLRLLGESGTLPIGEALNIDVAKPPAGQSQYAIFSATDIQGNT